MSGEPPGGLRVCLTVPFFSNLSYLQSALRSLVAQTDPQWTAIVVDDASLELGAEAVVAGLDDPRVRYVRNDRNLGIAANFNRCLELAAAEADVVAIFHADDELEPGYIAAVRAAHQRFPVATCVAPRARIIGSDGGPTRTLADSVKRALLPWQLPVEVAGDRGLARLMHGLFFYCPAVTYRVENLGALRFDPRWRQVMDLDFFARLLLRGGTVALVPDRVYRYRRHEASATAQSTRSLVRVGEEVAVSREIADAAHDKGWRRSVRASRLRLTVRLNALVEASKAVAHRRFRAAGEAVRHSVSR